MSSSWRRMTLSGWECCWELRVKSRLNTMLHESKWADMAWSYSNVMYWKLIDFGIRYSISRIMPFSRVGCLNSIPKACNTYSQWLNRVLRAQSVSSAQLMDISPVSYLDPFPKDNHISSVIEREAPSTNPQPWFFRTRPVSRYRVINIVW